MLACLFHYKESRLLKSLKELCKAAKKVIHYRCDILSQEVVDEIQAARKQALNFTKNYQWGDKSGLQSALDSLDALLKKHGGRIYPVHFVNENVEMIVVAAIIAIGFRSFFLQPFQIPTNSMYPSFYGMTEVLTANQPSQNPIEQVYRWAFKGASHYSVLAPATGELVVPLTGPDSKNGGGLLAFSIGPHPIFFGLIQETGRQYAFSVNGKSTLLSVPADYNLDDAFLAQYFSGKDNLQLILEEALHQGKIKLGRDGNYLWFTGILIKEGAPILDFDILSGDRVFVDRFTYNFRTPHVGESIVFYTRKIQGLAKADGTPDDRFYIKRLVGLPGDTLEVRPPALYRNGQPIEGSPAFLANAERKGLYPGYVPAWNMKADKPLVVPASGYFAMGDNSPHSLDSRNWGTVPPREVFGRSLFIYYPFSMRWGLTQ